MSQEKRTRKISSALQAPNFGDGQLSTIDESRPLRKVSQDATAAGRKVSTEKGLGKFDRRRISSENKDGAGRKVSTFNVTGRKTSTYVQPERLMAMQCG
ncbi:hypothetical protein MAR_026507 [Mya arenaria]|uniref:Uncharacterized protein n=1 Tax=Mya arenaria TaxID=6604 RepID=A0ABY7ETT2_MYAAR|nr:hypothetical protein MAR_026507 [Mya arenaria]